MAQACYGLLARSWPASTAPEEALWLRFVEGRPISAVTTQYLAWCCTKLAAAGQRVLVLIWDNASWHGSKAVRTWIASHNRTVKRVGIGVRIVGCPLPIKSPWLNPIEPKWVHGKRRAVEPDRLLTARETAERACEALGCDYEDHLALPQKVA